MTKSAADFDRSTGNHKRGVVITEQLGPRTLVLVFHSIVRVQLCPAFSEGEM
jgi:hypothetical protein